MTILAFLTEDLHEKWQRYNFLCVLDGRVETFTALQVETWQIHLPVFHLGGTTLVFLVPRVPIVYSIRHGEKEHGCFGLFHVRVNADKAITLLNLSFCEAILQLATSISLGLLPSLRVVLTKYPAVSDLHCSGLLFNMVM